MKFRKLKESEIEVRVQSVKDKGAILLLYKDARCDMNILDETVGALGWQRSHYECKGNLFCRVSIKQGDEWGHKDDAGKESYTDKEKGEASDSFKRACVNWGIGRELYTSPFIWVKREDITVQSMGGRQVVKDKFTVEKIAYDEEGRIDGLSIVNDKGKRVFLKKPGQALTSRTLEITNL